MSNNCVFCVTDNKDVIFANELCYAKWSLYAVNQGHMLIIPNRHFDDYFNASEQEKVALWTLVDEGKSLIDKKYNPDGYNVGINVGQAAGQTIMHLHIHIIPRYKGDMDDPRGGVRGVIPDRQKY